MFIIRSKHIFLSVTLALILLSALTLLIYGLKLGIDFTGGTLLDVAYEKDRPLPSKIHELLKPLNVGEVTVQPIGTDGIILRLRDITESEHQAILKALTGAKERSYNTIGPTLGRELRNRAFMAIIVVILGIVTYISFAFRKVSYPVKSWKYGFIAVITLMHDVIIPAGALSIMGRFQNTEADLLFVAAILAILGFSVHDTIVVFDRIRENLKLNISNDFGTTVGKSLEQTFVRSVNTSLTTIFVLLALYFLGGDSTKTFALILSIGIIAGTYSSIFVASPLLVYAEKVQRKKI